MKIAFVSKWFTEDLGYTENKLPWATANLGHEVHLITSNVNVYFGTSKYREIYEPVLGPGEVPVGTSFVNGVQIHRLRHKVRLSDLDMPNLLNYLRSISPDIIQTFDIVSPPTLQCANYCKQNKCKLFLECHTHRSIYPRGLRGALSLQLHSFLARVSNERSAITEVARRCYAIAPDTAEIAHKIFHIPKTIVVTDPLGVDTEIFFTCPDLRIRRETRQSLGLDKADLVLIYTGRFSDDKSPILLAEATELLATRSGLKIYSLFVGRGSEEYTTRLKSFSSAVVHNFVRTSDLVPFYWAADAGCWPREESTSQLDAMACGLPLILSNRVTAPERLGDCSVVYNEGDLESLVNRISKLLDPRVRQQMGCAAADRIQKDRSWSSIAKRRCQDYLNL